MKAFAFMLPGERRSSDDLRFWVERYYQRDKVVGYRYQVHDVDKGRFYRCRNLTEVFEAMREARGGSQ